ncbi:MAG: hypothetical protein P1P88_19030 [Bacteroidales bacterium]|nr:hypothetical protein [Bacteroidales bacterium]
MRSIKVFLFLITLIACNNTDVLYQSDEFTLYTYKVVQGDNVATIESANMIISNYQSRASENFSRLITFKFSINEKDNENPSGIDHWIVINGENKSPIIKFGQQDGPIPAEPEKMLTTNYEYTFRVDMTPVLNQFKEKGYFITYDGTRISKDDFKAVYIAGSSQPLTWDFDNLAENNLGLKDSDRDGIYEIKLVLNPEDLNQRESTEWNLTHDLSSRPSYHSDQKIVDALFNLSLEEAILTIEPDSTLRTGIEWPGVWTRDVSYSTILAFAFHEPEAAKISLKRKIARGRIIQDTGSGGAWPVSSDRVIWIVAAWEIYKVTGDMEWLKLAYEVAKNTLEDDYKTLRSIETGLYKGESSFLDWRQQTYPSWMSNADIAVSENLGTNAIHYQANVILARMAEILNQPNQIYQQRALAIKAGINKYLWMPKKGYYGQYLYGRSSLFLSDRFEALGEALTVLFDVASQEQANSIIEKSPVTPFGVTCIYPQIPGIPPYHNNGIWPFVQAYWNLAAAKAGNGKVLNHGLAAIYRAGSLFLTNYENFVAETGDYVGTEINSRRMLWSIAGNLAMVHRVFMGMSIEENGIKFQPVIPSNYSGIKQLSNFRYRNAILNIEIRGYGNKIASINLDGKQLHNSFLPANIEGAHKIAIVMANNDISTKNINLVKNTFSLTNPQAILFTDKIVWDTITGAANYNIYKNGTFFKKTNFNYVNIENSEFAEYTVSAVDKDGVESFTSEPILISKNEDMIFIQLEDYYSKSKLPYSNFTGNGFIEISPSINTEITVNVKVPEEGIYLLDCRYSNGTGPWNTDNNCALRSLYLNDDYVGVLVFPQRGKDEWSDWGFSNILQINLKKGNNNLQIIFKNWNNNMDGEINDAMIDYIRLIKL